MDDWDGYEPVDLDVTGDRQLDVYGYESPRRDFSPPPAPEIDWLAQAKRDRRRREQRRREAVAANLEETRQRNAQRRGKRHADASAASHGQPEPVAGYADALPPHVKAAVGQGAPGRAAGWYRLDVAADGTATWTRVDAPGDGPRVTVHGPEPVGLPTRRRWWQRRRPEQPQPSPGTQIW